MAGAEGIEPSSAVLETDVLPLNHAPISGKNPRNSHTWPERTTDILMKTSTYSQKIKRKYYKYFADLMQAVFFDKKVLAIKQQFMIKFC